MIGYGFWQGVFFRREANADLIARLKEILPEEYGGNSEWDDVDKLYEVHNALWHPEEDG